MREDDVTQLEWLADEENQVAVYSVVRRMLDEWQPDEVDFLDGVYENYIELAQEGDVSLDSKQQSFGFAGSQEFVTLWLLPIVVNIASSLIYVGGAWVLKKAIDRLMKQKGGELPEDDARVRECVKKALDENWASIDDEERLSLEEHLTQAFLSLSTD